MKANTKKNSTTKKLVPAAGSLLISAAMLGTSTYAWFTMSREVEVQNIQMTATVPEDIQIALGQINQTDTPTTISINVADGSLAYNSGYLDNSGDVVTAPRESGQYQSIDWSNTVDISHYYTFGRLIPASSDTGVNIFFTPDANGNGQTVKTDAKFYKAAEGLTAQSESEAGGAGSGTLKATAHVNNGTTWVAATSGTGTRSTAWNATNDDGYYIDIPVWLRTSSTAGADVKVKAYVVDRNTITNFGTDTNPTADNKELYRAVRVAILTDTGAAAASGTGNLIPVSDGDTSGATSKYGNGGVLDWYTAGGQSGANVTNPFKVWGGAVSSIPSQGSTSPTYTATPTEYNGNSSVAHLAAGAGNTYGTATKVWIRVWLEGEDPDCYNETAGQDWSINLMFEKI